MLNYRLISEKNDNSESYGIAVCENDKTVRIIPDISPYKEDISKIANICNQLEVELCHFEDIVEDYLTDFCI